MGSPLIASCPEALAPRPPEAPAQWEGAPWAKGSREVGMNARRRIMITTAVRAAGEVLPHARYMIAGSTHGSALTVRASAADCSDPSNEFLNKKEMISSDTRFARQLECGYPLHTRSTAGRGGLPPMIDLYGAGEMAVASDREHGRGRRHGKRAASARIAAPSWHRLVWAPASRARTRRRGPPWTATPELTKATNLRLQRKYDRAQPPARESV